MCITDYSSLIFEYSLFERPMIFYAFDLDQFYDYRGFYYPYDYSFLPGPIVKTNEELINAIKQEKPTLLSFLISEKDLWALAMAVLPKG